MTTLTPTQQATIAATVERMQLTRGLGDAENACSIAAINLALSGELTDRIPDCMSEVIGRWIIAIQDRMPDDMHNSSDWKRLLPLAAGTGRDHEPERLAVVMGWMWSALTLVQPVADAGGFGPEWQAMCCEQSNAAAKAAADAARAATVDAYAAHAAAYAAAYAADAADAAAKAAAYAAAYAADAHAADAAAAYAAHAAAYAAANAAYAATNWQTINPPALLERLIEL